MVGFHEMKFFVHPGRHLLRFYVRPKQSGSKLLLTESLQCL